MLLANYACDNCKWGFTETTDPNRSCPNCGSTNVRIDETAPIRRARIRADIRRRIRGDNDRIAQLLDELADRIEELENHPGIPKIT